MSLAVTFILISIFVEMRSIVEAEETSEFVRSVLQ